MLPLICTVLFPALALASFVVPLPSGPYGVSIQDVVLTDHDVRNPFLNTSYTRVPISIIAPTGPSSECEPVVQPYMPNLTAAVYEQGLSLDYSLPFSGQIQQTKLILCKPKPLSHSTPVIIFGPGASIARYFYNILGSAIAAHAGYTVITYDVPDQSLVDVFPDGTVEYESPITNLPSFTNADAVNNDTQAASIILDAIFLGDQSFGAKRPNITSSIPLSPMLKRTTQASIIGHSQGGAAAIIDLLTDPRYSSAANFDGQMNEADSSYNANGPSNKTTTKKPFAIFEHQGSNQTTSPSWPGVWANVLRGTKFQFQLNGTQHGSYGDFPYLVDLYGIRQNPNVSSTTADAAIGALPGTVVIETIRDVLSSFLAYGFGRTTARAVDEESASFEPWGFYVVNQTIVR